MQKNLWDAIPIDLINVLFVEYCTRTCSPTCGLETATTNIVRIR